MEANIEIYYLFQFDHIFVNVWIIFLHKNINRYICLLLQSEKYYVIFNYKLNNSTKNTFLGYLQISATFENASKEVINTVPFISELKVRNL